MDLSKFVSGGDEYHVFIAIGAVPVYEFFTSSVVARNITRPTQAIHALGSKKPIAVQSGNKEMAFNISLQSGEARAIVLAAKAVFETTGMSINDFTDFPQNTNITVINQNTLENETFINCRLGGDNKSIERQSLETLRELSGMCLDYIAY